MDTTRSYYYDPKLSYIKGIIDCLWREEKMSNTTAMALIETLNYINTYGTDTGTSKMGVVDD